MRAAPVFVFLAMAVFAGGAAACTTPYRALLAQNKENIERLTLGMSKAELIQVMTDCGTSVKGKPFNNPFQVDTWQKGSDVYEVLYYLTRHYQKFTPVRLSQTTPVVLRNGQVVGVGRAALEELRN